MIDISQLTPEMIEKTNELMPMLVRQQYTDPLYNLVAFLISGALTYFFMKWARACGEDLDDTGEEAAAVLLMVAILAGVAMVGSLWSIMYELIELINPEYEVWTEVIKNANK